MRIARLDLTRFGKFADRTLAFPQADCDLHVIYGPNEAGKSTVRSALLDWLYGIHPRTHFGFKHGYADMEIGGELVDPARGALAFRRLKRMKNTLVAGHGGPLTDADLAPWLGGLDRDAFERMFAIDHQRLQAGGEGVMANTDFGRMLFEAAAGVGDLTAVHKRIDAESRDLWGPHKRREAQFWQAEERLLAAKDTLNRVGLSEAQWKAAEQTYRDAKAAEDAADAQLAEATSRKQQLERIKRIAPGVAQYHEAQARLAAGGDVITLPDDAETTFRQAEAARTAAHVQRDLIAPKHARLVAERSAVVLSPELLARKDDIEALTQSRGVYRNAVADLPTVRSELASTRSALHAAARDLGWQADADTVVAKLPPSVLRAELSSHLHDESGHAQAVTSSAAAVVAQGDVVADLEARLAQAPKAHDLPALTRAIGAAQQIDDDALATATTAVRDAEASAARALGGLAPWAGTAEALASPLFPSHAEVSALVATRGTLASNCAAANEQEADAATACAGAEAALRNHRAQHDEVTPEALANLRRARDERWHAVRRGEVTPDAVGDDYEQEVRAADAGADVRYANAAAIATARELEGTVAARQREHEDRIAKRLHRDHELQDFDAQWRTRLAEAGAFYLPLQRYVEWLDLRSRALVAQDGVRSARAALADVERRIATAHAALAGALVEAEVVVPECDLAGLRDFAARVRDERTAARTRIDGWTTALATEQKALRAREREATGAATALADWKALYADLLARVGLAAGTTVAGAERALAVLQQVEQDAATARHQEARTGAMETEIARFETEANALVTACAPDIAGVPPAEVAATLATRLRLAEQAADAAARLDTAVADAAQQLADIAAREADALASVAPLMAAAGVSTNDELRVAVSRWGEHARAHAAVITARDAVVTNGDGLPFDTLVAAVAAQDLGSLASDLDAAGRRCADLEDVRTPAVETRTHAKAAFDQYAGQDTAVRAEGDRQDAILLMREAAEGYCRMAVGAKVLAWAIQRYSERKHEPLLKLASGLFAQLTLGSFTRLAVAHDEATMSLHAIRPNGDSVEMGNGLSTGTEAQLYLALRLASLYQHLDTAPCALPFLGDDLFMGTDEERAAAMLEVFAGLAGRTQVILLTHSARVAEIATATLGTRVNLIELPRDLPLAA